MTDPPAEVRAAAAGLGTLRRFERLVTKAFYYQVTASLVLVGVAGLVFVGWLLSREPEDVWMRVVLFLMAVGGIGVWVWLLAAGLHRARSVGAVDLYEYKGGFVQTSRLETIAFPWSGVHFVESVSFEGGAQGSGSRRRVYYLRRQDELDETRSLLSLNRDIDRIAALVVAATLPAALAAARSPAGVTFGALTLGPFGVTIGGQTTPWPEVDRVVREKEELRVYRAGQRKPWARTPVGTVPSAPVMLAVAERLIADYHAAQ